MHFLVKWESREKRGLAFSKIRCYTYYDRYTTTDVVTTGDTPTVNIWHAGKEEGT